ncbi:hypothetical protein FRC01_005706 [Tulasnella sp. 417]|nr:hypothetical protein FRC01_005706 [Tulasnella sp. 417]
MTYTSDEYDENDDVRELNSIPPAPMYGNNIRGSKEERLIRRRSSKACDGCRKAKCKCERTPEAISNGDPCRNCVLLGQGPPKGYIDALESKLHQMEALLGTIITSDDVRARTLIYDLSQDPLAREIIQRVDETPFGTRGRKQAAANRELYGRSGGLGMSNKRRDSAGGLRGSPGEGESRFGFSGPPHEWQDGLTNLLNARPHERHHSNGSSSGTKFSEAVSSVPGPAPSLGSTTGTDSPHSGFSAGLNLDEQKPAVHSNYAFDPSNPYQRRRIDTPSSPPLNLITGRGLGNPVPLSSSSTSSFNHHGPARTRSNKSLAAEYAGSHSNTPPMMQYRGSTYGDEESDSDASDLADNVGQLSINDHKQVRYHGKASGLHLLMPAMEDADDPMTGTQASTGSSKGTRVKGGIWEFPPAGVWPPAPRKPLEGSVIPYMELRRAGDDDQIDAVGAAYLPDRMKQEHLVGLYFNYIHPVLPVLHRKQFFRDFAIRNDPTHPSYTQALARIPNFLLLAMFSVAARYSNETPLPPDGEMWTAGDDYFDRARELLVTFTSLSRLEYVQAMLLMGYREIGLGTMAQAWLYLGVAIRSAQDVGLHRSLAKWQVAGARRFTDEEKETRARIWHCAVRLDRYVSTYIGRPLSVYEHDYDTHIPEEDPEEENELWAEYPTFAAGVEQIEHLKLSSKPQPARVISCFKQSITLSKLLGGIVRNLYVIRVPSSSTRYRERALIEQKLEKWLIELPEHFRCENPNKPTSPNVLTLHMQYWCTVLLLNRPFIRPHERNPSSPGSSSSGEPEDLAAVMAKAFATCQNAANQITNIASAFADAFCIRRAPAIFTYYIFTASIMHVTSRPTLNQYALPPIQRSAATLSSVNSDYPQRSPPHNTQGYNSPSFSDPSAMVQSSFDAPVQSYETWSSQPSQHGARQSLGQSPTSQLSSHAVPSSYQHASVPESQYSYASSHVTLPPLSSYTQGIAGTTLPSQPSPFQDQYTSSPVPTDSQRFSNAGSGYWSGYQSNDPFGDPSLLSYASVVQPQGPQGYDNAGAHAVMQAALQEPSHPSHLPSGFSAINAYFSDTGTSGVYYGSVCRTDLSGAEPWGALHWILDCIIDPPTTKDQMVSKPLGEDQQQAIEALRVLGTGHDEHALITILKQNNWDIEKAAGDLFSDPPPVRSDPSPTPVPKSVTVVPPPSPTHTSTSLTLYHRPAPVFENASSSAAREADHSGALNAPPRMVKSQNSRFPLEHEVVDLTGEADEDEDLRKAMEMSLQETSQPQSTSTALVPVAGPKPRGDDTPLKPMDHSGLGISHEDHALHQALEASLSTSLNADVFVELADEDNVRKEGFPTLIRSRNLSHVSATLLLQALFAVPQLRIAMAAWRADEKEILDYPYVNLVQQVFANLDQCQMAALPLDEGFIALFGNPFLHPNSPGDDIKELYDGAIARRCEAVFAEQGFLSVDPETDLAPRVMLSRTGSSDTAIHYPADLSVNDIATLDVMSVTTLAEPNTLEAAIFRHMLKHPTPSFFVRRAPVLGIRVTRHDGPSAERTPLSYSSRLHLDPYLWENRLLVDQKMQEMKQCFEEAEMLQKTAQHFTAREGQDPMADLKRTIHYLEHVAQPGADEERAMRLKSMADKLKATLEGLDGQLARIPECKERSQELLKKAAGMLYIPELTRIAYDLRAVLVHDGLLGREHSYAYLRDPESNKWFRVCDASVEEVPEATVLNDSTGLHLNAGPYYFLYSEALPDDYAFPELAWPDDHLERIAEENAQLRNKLPLELAQKLEGLDRALHSRLDALPSDTVETQTMDTS